MPRLVPRAGMGSPSQGANILPYLGNLPLWQAGLPVAGDVADPSGRGGTVIELTDTKTLDNTRFIVSDQIQYLFTCWMRASKPGSVAYLELRDQHGEHAVASGTAGAANSAYLVGRMDVPASWQKIESTITLKPGVQAVYLGALFVNHSYGATRDAVVQLAGMSLIPCGLKN